MTVTKSSSLSWIILIIVISTTIVSAQVTKPTDLKKGETPSYKNKDEASQRGHHGENHGSPLPSYGFLGEELQKAAKAVLQRPLLEAESVIRAFLNALTWPSFLCLLLSIAGIYYNKESITAYIAILAISLWFTWDLNQIDAFGPIASYMVKHRFEYTLALICTTAYACMVGCHKENWPHVVRWMGRVKRNMEILCGTFRTSALIASPRILLKMLFDESVMAKRLAITYGISGETRMNCMSELVPPPELCIHQKFRDVLDLLKDRIWMIAFVLLFHKYLPIALLCYAATASSKRLKMLRHPTNDMIFFLTICLLCWIGECPHLILSTAMVATTVCSSLSYKQKQCAVCRLHKPTAADYTLSKGKFLPDCERDGELGYRGRKFDPKVS